MYIFMYDEIYEYYLHTHCAQFSMILFQKVMSTVLHVNGIILLLLVYLETSFANYFI